MIGCRRSGTFPARARGGTGAVASPAALTRPGAARRVGWTGSAGLEHAAMQVSVKGKQMDVGDALRGHVTHSLESVVGKYFGNAIDAHAVFARETYRFCCDLSVHIGRDILVQSEGDA